MACLFCRTLRPWKSTPSGVLEELGELGLDNILEGLTELGVALEIELKEKTEGLEGLEKKGQDTIPPPIFPP